MVIFYQFTDDAFGLTRDEFCRLAAEVRTRNVAIATGDERTGVNILQRETIA